MRGDFRGFGSPNDTLTPKAMTPVLAEPIFIKPINAHSHKKQT